MKRSLLLFLVISLLSSLIGCSGGDNNKEAVQSSLTSEPAAMALAEQVGVTADQAVGGLGAILSLAKYKVTPEDFTTLTNGIPSAQKYMDAAREMGVKGEIKDMIDLKGAYQTLGMSEQQASSFSPAAVNYIRSTGGEAAAGVLSSLGL